MIRTASGTKAACSAEKKRKRNGGNGPSKAAEERGRCIEGSSIERNLRTSAERNVEARRKDACTGHMSKDHHAAWREGEARKDSLRCGAAGLPWTPSNGKEKMHGHKFQSSTQREESMEGGFESYGSQEGEFHDIVDQDWKGEENVEARRRAARHEEIDEELLHLAERVRIRHPIPFCDAHTYVRVWPEIRA